MVITIKKTNDNRKNANNKERFNNLFYHCTIEFQDYVILRSREGGRI